MGKTAFCICSLMGLAAAALPALAQPARSTISQSLTAPAFPLSRVENALIEFPLPKGAEAYRAIDGK
jgi:hypothetical protein